MDINELTPDQAAFQKNLVVWKFIISYNKKEAKGIVSEELSSVETCENILHIVEKDQRFRRT